MINKSNSPNSNLQGILFLILALWIISTQSIVVKLLAGSYPVLQMVVLRNLVALPITLFLYRSEGGRGMPLSKKPGLEILRGIFLFVSYTSYMMGVVDLQLSQVEAIRFSGPVMIMLFSIILLKERVVWYRWIMLAVGLAGVTMIIRPGSSDFNSASILILVSVLFYALTAIVTGKLKDYDRSGTMAFYSSAVYLACALILTPVTLMVGELPDAPGSISFLFNTWTMPSLLDGIIMCSLGLVWAGWTYSMTHAYSLAPASVLAGYEYLSLPINAFWGFLIWKEIPALSTLGGSGMIILAGFFVAYMDRRMKRVLCHAK